MNAPTQPAANIPPQNTEAEASMLGAILIDSDAIVKVADIVKPADFYDERHARIFEAAIQLYEKHSPIDVLTLSDQLRSTNMLEMVGGAGYLTELTNFVPTASHADRYADIVAEKSMRRKMIRASQDITKLGFDEAQSIQELVEAAESRLFEVSQRQVKQDMASIETVLSASFDRLDELHKDKGKLRGVPTGFRDLDNILAGLQPSDLFVLAARPAMGKAQPLDAKVLTSSGWKAMGAIEVGDALASVDGKPSTVTGVFPQDKQQIFRISFSDGRSTEATAEHLWTVHYRTWLAPRVLTTEKVATMLERVRYKNRLWIDTCDGKFGNDRPLPVPPWVLGILISEGDFNSLRFSTANSHVLTRMKAELGTNFAVHHAGNYDYRIVKGDHQLGRVNLLRDHLRSFGLWGCKSEAKFIPSQYLNSDKASRLSLLQGLLDGDGWVEKFGAVRFATSSEQLADDVVYLVRSLGGWATKRSKQPYFTYKDERKKGLTSYVVNIAYKDAASLFSITEKKIRTVVYTKNKRPTFSSITPTRNAEAQCIMVSHPSQLYITDDFVVTHNTALSLNMAHNVAIKANMPVLFFSLEMSKEQLVDRLLSAEAQVDAWALRTGNLTDDDFEKIGQAMGTLSEAQIYIDDSPGITVSDMRTKARREAHRHPLGLIVVDYLQLMSGGSRYGGDGNRVQEISEISRGLKGIARELNVPVLALSQLSRSVENRSPQIPQLADLRDSGSIEQDADVVAFIYREEYYNPDTEKKNITTIFIKKHRNGPTGDVDLYFDRQKQKFRSLDTRRSQPFDS